MLKKMATASSRREMAQRDSVELWGTGGASVPCRSSPSPAQPHPHPRGTHIDAGGIEGALAGDRGEGVVGDGAGGQQHPALVGQGEPDGHEQPQQAAQTAQAAAGAQGEQRPLLQRERRGSAGTRGCPLARTRELWGFCSAPGAARGAGGAYQGSRAEETGQQQGRDSAGDDLRGSTAGSARAAAGTPVPFPCCHCRWKLIQGAALHLPQPQAVTNPGVFNSMLLEKLL